MVDVGDVANLNDEIIKLNLEKESDVDNITKSEEEQIGNNATVKHRMRLPCHTHPRNEMNIISILKQCIGKDLTKITMPVILNEPLSFLQRMVEYMECSYLLKLASDAPDPVQRLEYITAFAVSASSSNWERLGKPFNPILGETYELERPDLGFRVICEQVSHHPPVSAFHAEGDHFKLHGSIHPRMRLWGKSVEVTPKGTITLCLCRHNETYTWQNVNCNINNVFVGKRWIERSGTLEVLNNTTKHHCSLNFKQADFSGRGAHQVEGYIFEPSSGGNSGGMLGGGGFLGGGGKARKLRALQGKWTEALYSYDVDVWEKYVKLHRRSQSPFNLVKTPTEVLPSRGSNPDLNLTNQKLLWKVQPRPPDSEKYYNFTAFALSLNELTDQMASVLPPTDSRFRPDMRSMEEGDIDKAATEKNRMEEKQREMKRKRKMMKEEWSPRWFRGSSGASEGDTWQFKGDYWNRDYKDCPDVF